MLNDFHMMVLVLIATQGGIAMLLVVMATLEPEKPEGTRRAKVAGSARTSPRAGQSPPALNRQR